MECDGCGAALGPNDIACRYCRRATPFAARHQAESRAQEARAVAEREALVSRERATKQEELQKVSKRALVFGLLGTVMCLLPFFSIFSVVAYFRARKLAAEIGVAVPGHATSGFALSAFWLVAGPVFLTWAIVRDNAAQDRTNARIAVLEAQIATAAQAPALDAPTACALAELHALKTGHAGERGKNLEHFDCPGALGGTPARPVLDRFSFTNGINDTRFQVTACFDRAARWYVKEFVTGRPCAP